MPSFIFLYRRLASSLFRNHLGSASTSKSGTEMIQSCKFWFVCIGFTIKNPFQTLIQAYSPDIQERRQWECPSETCQATCPAELKKCLWSCSKSVTFPRKGLGIDFIRGIACQKRYRDSVNIHIRPLSLIGVWYWFGGGSC